MSTQNKQVSSASFDPTSMGVFQGFQPQYAQAMSSMVNDPYSNMFFNQQLGRQQQMFGQSQQAQQEAMLQRAQALGINPNSPAFFSQMNQLQRQGMANQAGGFNSLLMQAGNLRQQALGQMGRYRPLQTGETKTQTQSGLGTWLPQVIGAGLGIAGAAMGGPAGLGMGAFGKTMATTGHMGQGSDTSMWSGQGSNSGIQPSMYSAPTELQNPFMPSYYGGS